MQFTYISLQEMIQKLLMVIAKSFIHDSMTEYPVMKLYPRSKQKAVNISKIANNFINFKNRSDVLKASAGVLEIFCSVEEIF